MNGPFNPVGGAVEHMRGAGFPATERVMSTFQTLDVSGQSAWRQLQVNWSAQWTTGLVLAWPQLRDEQAVGTVPRRFPGCVVEMEVLDTSLLAEGNAHLWKCYLNIEVSSGKHDRMRSMYRLMPEISESLIESNLCWRFTLNPAPKQFRLTWTFSRPDEPDNKMTPIQGNIRPLHAGWQP
jgi:hypothetical protein